MPKFRIAAGIGGAGLFSLQFVLDRVWPNPEPLVLWTIGIISCLLILFAFFGPLIVRVLRGLLGDTEAAPQQTTAGGHVSNVALGGGSVAGNLNVFTGNQTYSPAPNNTAESVIEIQYRVKDNFAELCLHNPSRKQSVKNIEVTFRNYSLKYDNYTPIDVLMPIIPRGRTAEVVTIAAGNQEYYRFARSRTDKGHGYLQLLAGEKKLGGKIPRLCVVKLKIIGESLPAQNVYFALGLDQYGGLTAEPYQRTK